MQFVHNIDRLGLWHRLPVILGLLYLQTRRDLHDKYNLLNVGSNHSLRFNPDEFAYRTDNGEFNDPKDSKAGSELTFIGRNMPPLAQDHQVITDHPTLSLIPFVICG